MEYFRIVNVKTTERYIQESVSMENLDKISEQIFVIGNQSETKATIGGIWGEFTLVLTRIKGGVRFALQECPNALCWTITTGYPPDKESVIVHLTINRLEIKQEFIAEIEEFLDDQCDHLKTFLFYNKTETAASKR